MEGVHLDSLGPINPRSKSGSAYILVMLDQFTKWVELAPLPAQNAELTAGSFLKHFVSTFGCPLGVHTDQGRNFESDLFQAFCQILEITLVMFIRVAHVPIVIGFLRNKIIYLSRKLTLLVEMLINYNLRSVNIIGVDQSGRRIYCSQANCM